MTEQRTYPHGVPCWIDAEQPDQPEASRFYGSLFGWTFEEAMPPGAPGSYLIAKLDGVDVAAIGAASTPTATWNTYVAVDDADSMVERVTEAGGRVVSPPWDAGPGGRAAIFTDAIAWLVPVTDDEVPHWHVSFAVADRDAAVATAIGLGAVDLRGPIDTMWTKAADIRDPQGATFTLSQFTPREA